MGVELEAEEESPVFAIPPESLAGIDAFYGLQTQWRWATAGGESLRSVRVGLDYTAVDVYLRRHGVEDTGTFDDIAVMELAALETFAEVANG